MQEQLVDGSRQLIQVVHLEGAVAVSGIPWHVGIASAPQGRRFRVQPDGGTSPAGDIAESIQARIVEIVAPITDDNEGGAVVDGIHVGFGEILQRKAQIGIVMTAGHAPQDLVDGLV